MMNCENRRPVYVGRAASASPATGYMSDHNQEQQLLLEQALTWNLSDLLQPFQRQTRLTELVNSYFKDCF